MPNKNIKILCVCQKGCSRSVGTVYRLNRRHFNNVLAVGHQTTSAETLRMLCEWADIILLAEPHMLEHLPLEGLWPKVEHRFTIGPDVWGKAFHPELQEIIKGQLNALGFR